jgi:hypothetical protein
MVDAMYSIPQWGMVKTWELNNQFQLEGFRRTFLAHKPIRAPGIATCRSLWLPMS